MPRRTVIPAALMILLLVLAACSGGGNAAESQVEPAARSETAVVEDAAMEAIEDEQMEAMDEMAEGGDDMADEDAMQTMDESHEDDMENAESMEAMDEDQNAAMDGEAAMEAMDADHEGAMDEAGESMAGDSMDEPMGVERPAWQAIALSNAATGEQFTLSDFQGKTVFVEPMATWCSNCRMQQGQVREAKDQLGEDVVFIGLSLETNLPPEQLASYAEGNGFDWTYAVMTVELLSQLSDEFGRSITSAPSTPHFIIRPDGSFSDLATGIHSADEIIAEIQAEQG